MYTHSGSCLRLDSAHSEVLLEKCSWFRKSRPSSWLCFPLKKTVRLAFSTAYKPTSAFRETSPLSFRSACFSQPSDKQSFLGHTLHPLARLGTFSDPTSPHSVGVGCKPREYPALGVSCVGCKEGGL